MKLKYKVQIQPITPTEIEVDVEFSDETVSRQDMAAEIDRQVAEKVSKLTIPMVALSWQLKGIL